MPTTRNRAHAPTLQSRRHSIDGSIASTPSDEFESFDESIQPVTGRGPMNPTLADLQRVYQAQGGEEVEGDEDDEDIGEEGEDGRLTGLLSFMLLLHNTSLSCVFIEGRKH